MATDMKTAVQEAQGRKLVRLNFIASEKDQAKLYTRDLEKTLKINKEVITELISTSLPEEKYKKALERLNGENAILHAQVERLMLEREEVAGKLLITEQIVATLRKNEGECYKELMEKQKEILDQLNRKEFLMQKLERKYEKALTALKTLEHKDQDASRILKLLKADKRVDCKLTNVVEQNEQLQTELMKVKAKVQELMTQGHKETGEGESDGMGIKAAESVKLRKKKNNVERGAEAKMLKEEVARLNLRIEELYKINLNLSEALRSANDKLLSISKKGSSKNRNRSRSGLTHCSESNKSTTKKKSIEPFKVERDLESELKALPSPIQKVYKKLLSCHCALLST
eukprot:TRINITY_DN3688_c0_g5_i1.p1 TRINITY_DN3688_c0_g5~~TRINITY_DN3688_c0_g5_i1.p1  ORF type:complete len:344 (+),score=116.88 TRINITY_DN3688_c0_g5_i1:3-1034(+)